MNLDQISSADFLKHLNGVFTVELEGTPEIELELVEVMNLNQSGNPGSRQPFALYFLGPASDLYLVQHTYPIRHPQLGLLEIFIVPLGFGDGRMRYEAIFS